LLFLLSALFWWYFEGARRRVQMLWTSSVRRTACKILEESEESQTSCANELETEDELFSDDSTVEWETNGSVIDAVPESADESRESQDEAPVNIVDDNAKAEPEVPEVLEVYENTCMEAVVLPTAVSEFTRPFFPPPGLELPVPSEVTVSLPTMTWTPAVATNTPQMPKTPQTSNKKRAAAKNPKQKQEPPKRELARCVCWKDSFGFLVDENSTRLFVRQNDVEGEQKLIAGQVVWFRRARQQTSQTPKASDVFLVDIELAKMLRTAEREGLSWATLRQGVVDGDADVIKCFSQLPGVKGFKNKLDHFQAEALKGPKTAVASKTTEKLAAAKAAVAATNKVDTTKSALGPELASPCDDDDLSAFFAFLGSGTVEEMRANLKYAPKWVVDKFQATHGKA